MLSSGTAADDATVAPELFAVGLPGTNGHRLQTCATKGRKRGQEEPLMGRADPDGGRFPGARQPDPMAGLPTDAPPPALPCPAPPAAGAILQNPNSRN